jgi:5'-nucleotidase
MAKKDGFEPDLIISGINLGCNLGRDVFYSGTFGAAREAYFQGYPAVALSNMSKNEPV